MLKLSLINMVGPTRYINNNVKCTTKNYNIILWSSKFYQVSIVVSL